MDELLDILQEILSIPSKDDKAMDTTIEKIVNLYNDDEFRHSYAELSRFFEELGADERIDLLEKLDHILTAIDLKFTNDITKKIGKLTDHLELESIRLGRIERIDILYKDFENKRIETEDNSRKIKSEMDKVSAVVNNANAQTISILGIFAGIVVAFSFLGSIAIESIQDVCDLHLYKLLLYLDFLGLIIFDTIFLLMYCISKLVGISMATNCKSRGCEECQENHNWIIRAARKYPFVLAVNVIMCLLFFLLVVLLAYVGQI